MGQRTRKDKLTWQDTATLCPLWVTSRRPAVACPGSALPLKADIPISRDHVGIGSFADMAALPMQVRSALKSGHWAGGRQVRFGPCVDGSGMARRIFTSQPLVGAAMCSAFECGTHDRWP